MIYGLLKESIIRNENRINIIFLFSLTLVTDLVAIGYNECAQNLSIFVENAKVKNYKAAYETWSLVRNECPSMNSAIYIYGERILKKD